MVEACREAQWSAVKRRETPWNAVKRRETPWSAGREMKAMKKWEERKG